jgi:hypothetical protein
MSPRQLEELEATGKVTIRLGGSKQRQSSRPHSASAPRADQSWAERVPMTAPPRRDPLACIHLLEQLGRDVEQAGCGCRGNKLTSVWGCELFVSVAPFAKGTPIDASVKACSRCERYEASVELTAVPSPAPSPAPLPISEPAEPSEPDAGQ